MDNSTDTAEILRKQIEALENIIYEQHKDLVTFDRRLAEVTFQRNAFEHSRFGRARRFYLRWKNWILARSGKPVVDDNAFPLSIYHPPPPLPTLPANPTPSSTRVERVPIPENATVFFAPPDTAQYDIIYFSIIEWEHLTQRPQQLMSQLSAHGHRVFWIDVHLSPDRGIPEIDLPLKELAPGIYRIRLPAPADLIYYAQLGKPEITRIERVFELLRSAYAIECAVSLVNFPGWWPVAETLRTKFGWRVVYDCLDDQSEFRKMHNFRTVDYELNAAKGADLVVTTSQVLFDKMQPLARKITLIRNGTDFEFFSHPPIDTHFLGTLSQPIIGFFGTIHEWLDLDLLEKSAIRYPNWQITIIGRLNLVTADALGKFERLQKLSNVHYLGQVDFEKLPGYLARFDVCVVPFQVMPVTVAMNIVKIYDYLAAGKPVVAADLPEVRPFVERGVVTTYRTDQDFFAAIESAISSPGSGEQVERRQQTARENTWQKRCADLELAIAELHPMVTIIIVTFNNLTYTRFCVDSLFARTRWPRFRIVFVDNGSGPELLQYLHDLETRNGNVSVIVNNANLGFARANNIGLERYRDSTDYFVLLNDDTVVTTDWLPRLIRHLDQPSVGLVGPVTSFTGNEARIPTGYTDLSDMNAWAQQYSRAHIDQLFDIRMLSGYCIAFKRQTLDQVGLLDERFTIGMFEDDDFSRRIKAAGMRVVCCEDVFIHHWGRTSFKKLNVNEYDQIFDSHRALYEAKWGETWSPHQSRPEDSK